MSNLQWGHVFIWIGVGLIALLTGIIISSIRRSWRRSKMSRIPNKSMSIFKVGATNERMAKTIDEHLESSFDTKLVSAPMAPTRALWSWAAPGSELGEVNFQQAVLSSPRLIEHAARTCSKGVWGIRHPSQSVEDYMLMISPHLSSLPEDSVEKYLEKYIAVRYNNVRLTKRQYTAWLKHFIAVLHALDAEAPKSVELLASNSNSLNSPERPRKKRKNATKSTL